MALSSSADSNFGGAIGTGLTVGFQTGNPLAGIAAGAISFFTAEANSRAQDEYNQQLAALASLEQDRAEVAAVLQKDYNELMFTQDMFAAERQRRSLAYAGTMARAGVANYVAQTGLEGDSSTIAARQRLSTQEKRAYQDSLRSQETALQAFLLQQQTIDASIAEDPYAVLSMDQAMLGLAEGNIQWEDLATQNPDVYEALLATPEGSASVYDQFVEEFEANPGGGLATPGIATAATTDEPLEYTGTGAPEPDYVRVDDSLSTGSQYALAGY